MSLWSADRRAALPEGASVLRVAGGSNRVSCAKSLQAGPDGALPSIPAIGDASGGPPCGRVDQNSNPVRPSRLRSGPDGPIRQPGVAGVTESPTSGAGTWLRQDVAPGVGAEAFVDPGLGAGSLLVGQRAGAEVGEGAELGDEVIDDFLAGQVGL